MKYKQKEWLTDSDKQDIWDSLLIRYWEIDGKLFCLYMRYISSVYSIDEGVQLAIKDVLKMVSEAAPKRRCLDRLYNGELGVFELKKPVRAFVYERSKSIQEYLFNHLDDCYGILPKIQNYKWVRVKQKDRIVESNKKRSKRMGLDATVFISSRQLDQGHDWSKVK